MKSLFILVYGIVAFLFFSCSTSTTSTAPADFLAADMDSSVSPSQDFFEYANGGWIKKTLIPADESSWGIGYMVQDEIYSRLKKINEEALQQQAAPGSVAQKVSDFWGSGMDTIALEKQGTSPLQEDLGLINKINSVPDIVHVAALFHQKGIGCLFTEYIAQDDKNSAEMAYQLYQGGLGMPNRDYYFNTDEKTVNVRNAYQKYLYKTFLELRDDSTASKKNALAVFQLETRLAKASRKLADLRDPYANYHKMDIGSLQKLSPNINWPVYLKESGINKLDSAIVGQPEFYAALNAELAPANINNWKNYLRFHLVLSSSPFLDSATYNNYFDYAKTRTGASTPRPRWKRVLDVEEGAIGEALGQLFVKEYFNEKAKQRYSDLVEAMRSAFKERIEKLTWMSDSTKKKALDKLARMTKKVGYPDKWKDFSAMQIGKVPYVINVQHARQWWHNYEVNKLGKPVDRTEWDMTPQTYNAYYNPSNNEIVLPAGQFAVPGKKDDDLDDAFVYGYAAASTIGHEMTHGFDDQGRQYDANGNLKGWWTPADSIQFSERAAKIIAQFNEFNPVDTLHINGSATQGENIADLGGLLIGIDAFRKTDTYKKGEKIAGFTPIQRYFLGYAYSWLYKQRKELLASQLMTDVHAPAKERVNGPVVNVPEFYETFNVKPGDKMYRPDSLRVNIW
ncbi:MAG: M13 family metallopeptidase [Bacteroidetes bacterium]|nr:M13 family metallopeptidase [Bacteroidota bacterium]